MIDLMQLVREIEVGVDTDGDGARDLDASRISYYGQSFGGIYGTKFLAVEPNVLTGVPNVPGGAIIEIARLSPVFRPLVGLGLVARTPSLINIGGISFNENMPLRNQPPLVDTVPGASAIQENLDRIEWVTQAGNPVSYAPHLRADPLRGRAREVDPPPVRQGRPDRPEPDRLGDHPGGGNRGPDDALPQRPGVPARCRVPEEPAHVPDEHRGHAVRGGGCGRRADPDRGVLRLGRHDRHRSGRRGPLFETPMVGAPPEDLAYIP